MNFRPIVNPMTTAPKNNSKKIANKNCAMPADALAISVNPKIPAINAMMRKITAHLSMIRAP